jgi:adenylate kinase
VTSAAESTAAAPLRLALIGPPGAGKGTQAAALGHQFGVPVLSTGELLRERAARGDETGQTLAVVLARGDLVPDPVVLAVLHDALSRPGAPIGYILDGFPRTVTQAEATQVPPVDAVVFLALPDDVARERIAHRGALGRSDDTAHTVENRLRKYHEATEPLLDLYRNRGLLIEVDGSRPVADVTDSIIRAVNARGAAPGTTS